MQGQNQQQAYDRGITIFSPDGRLYQVEYAREAVKRGSASVGVRTPEGVVLAAERRSRSPLMERDSVEKLHKVDNHIGIASAGHVADARQLIDVARRQAQVNQLRYDETIGVETLTKHVTDHIQQYTQTGGARPFGVALLVGGVENGTPRLFETDPSGTPYEWKAIAIGGNREEIQSHLEENYSDDLELEAGIDLAIEAMARSSEDGFPAEGLAIATIDTETGQYRNLTVAEIEERLQELDLLSEGDEE
ncbi:archaeal proteasome endopeptidase complex subunit alpha [Haloarchaeobius sp. TZWWS8]|uniref:archaeal proteasome endopeptidase complex subunit alpha n=1 Tax=Haloarchaeobius sp. TZWWS8 TaxID=3446121 RepID=UPI003EBE4819